MQQPTRRRAAGAAATTLTACALFATAVVPASALTVTFIRHGESYGNATNHIDTSIPGPDLTDKGEGQAAAIATYLQSPEYTSKYGAVDAIYASTMIRTQETAKPLSDATGMPITILGFPKDTNAGERIGVQEISAGIFEGLPESTGIGRIGYILAPLAWTLGLQFVSVPGGESGLEFNERMTNALTQVAEDTPEGNDGEQNAAVFSHGATIMMWTMMNVDNPNLLLILQHPLSNTDVVVVTQNDDGTWHLDSWAGEDVADANYPTQMFVNFRNLIVAPQKALYDMRVPVLTPDPSGIVTTGVKGIQDVANAGVTFVKNSVTDTVNAITGIPNSVSSTLNPTSASTLSATTDSSTVDVTDGAKTAVSNATNGIQAAVEKTSEQVKSSVEKVKTDVDKTIQKATDKLKTTGTTNLAQTTSGGTTSPNLRTAANDARKQISSSAQKAGEAVRKAVTKAAHGSNKASDQKASADNSSDGK